MKIKKTTYCRGLEIYYSPQTGLTGIEVRNDDGDQATYTGLTDDEAQAWLAKFLAGERFVR